MLIAYDGSADAKAAIEQAAKLCRPDEPVVVLTVWQRFADTLARTGAGLGTAGIIDSEEIDREALAAAEERAAEGAALARQAGLEARPHAEVLRRSVAETIVQQADALDTSTIVIGSRGLTGLKSFLLGSVSHGVLVHADRPVIVVPSPEVAQARAKHLHPEKARA